MFDSRDARIIKWIGYTIVLGFVFVAIRFFRYYLVEAPDFELFEVADFLSFVLVLNVANLNELEHLNDARKADKTFFNIISLLLIIASIWLYVEYLDESIRYNYLLILSWFFSLISLILNIFVLRHLLNLR